MGLINYAEATWEEGCLKASSDIYELIERPDADYCYSPTEAIKALRAELAQWDEVDNPVAGVYFAAMGAVATYCATKVNCDDSTFDCLERIEELIAAKQHDYGHGNIDRFGLLGIVVRISDKLARLENLYDRGGDGDAALHLDDDDQPYVESIADTWDDIVGYCIIALMVLDDTFKLPLAADQEVPDNKIVDFERIAAAAAFLITEQNDAYAIRDDGVWEYLGKTVAALYSTKGF